MQAANVVCPEKGQCRRQPCTHRGWETAQLHDKPEALCAQADSGWGQWQKYYLPTTTRHQGSRRHLKWSYFASKFWDIVTKHSNYSHMCGQQICWFFKKDYSYWNLFCYVYFEFCYTIRLSSGCNAWAALPMAITSKIAAPCSSPPTHCGLNPKRILELLQQHSTSLFSTAYHLSCI